MPKRTHSDAQSKITDFYSTVRDASQNSPTAKRLRAKHLHLSPVSLGNNRLQEYLKAAKEREVHDEKGDDCGRTVRRKLFAAVREDAAKKCCPTVEASSSGTQRAKFILPMLMNNSSNLLRLKQGLQRLDTVTSRLDGVRKKQRQDEKAKQSTSVCPDLPVDLLKDIVSEETDFLLPNHFRELLTTFRATDLFVGIMCSRRETPVFRKMRIFVEGITKKSFELKHLGQIKAVYPNAYNFEIGELSHTKCASAETGPYDMFILPRLTDDIPQTDVEIPVSNKSFQLASSPKSPIKLNIKLSPMKQLPLTVAGKRVTSVTVSTEKFYLDSHRQRLRLEVMRQELQRRVRHAHRQFLASLDPPVQLSKQEEAKLLRWHPKFPLEEVAPIEPAQLPAFPSRFGHVTAAEFFASANDKLSSRVHEAALTVIKEKDCERRQPVTPETSCASDAKFAASVRNLPLHVLQKVREKQAAKEKELMFRTSEQTIIAKRKSHLYDMAMVLKYAYASSERTCMRKWDVLKEWRQSFPAIGDYDEHLKLLCLVVPEWISTLSTKTTDEMVKVTSYEQCKTVMEKLRHISQDASKYLVYGNQ